MGYKPPVNKNLPPIQPAVQPHEHQTATQEERMPHVGLWESFFGGLTSPLRQSWKDWYEMGLTYRQWLNQNPGKTYNDYLSFRKRNSRRFFHRRSSIGQGWFKRALLNIENIEVPLPQEQGIPNSQREL